VLAELLLLGEGGEARLDFVESENAPGGVELDHAIGQLIQLLGRHRVGGLDQLAFGRRRAWCRIGHREESAGVWICLDVFENHSIRRPQRGW
jgi:hypothetical protein